MQAKHSVTKIISAVTAVILSFCFLSCGNGEVIAAIDGQAAQIKMLTEQINELTKQLDTLQKQSQDSNERADELFKQLNEKTQEIEILKASIDNLSGKPIEFTASKPIYGKDENRKIYASFNNDGEEPMNYQGFLEYCKKEIADKIEDYFYCFEPLLDEYDNRPNRWKEFDILYDDIADGKFVNPVIREFYMMYTPVLGDVDNIFDAGMYGGVPQSLTMDLYLVPVPLGTSRYPIVLEFGNNGSGNLNQYINIYLDEFCMGTCYYEEFAYVSQNWFQCYFLNNLENINNVIIGER